MFLNVKSRDEIGGGELSVEDDMKIEINYFVLYHCVCFCGVSVDVCVFLCVFVCVCGGSEESQNMFLRGRWGRFFLVNFFF